MINTDQIKKHLTFSKHYLPGVVAYEIGPNANGDNWKYIQLIFNNNENPVVFPVEKRKWKEVVRGFVVDENGIVEHFSDSIFVPPVSMIMLVADE